MLEVTCPVCGVDFEVPEGKGVGDILSCPYCRARLRLTLDDGEVVATGA
ncbi:MAG: alpha-aminoadipate/glutamate carrier protein LysW [Bacillota bacterium]|jgi:Zn-finger nucleic acid-binding protein|nr:alpha-aminoadipate/glutamate carrier protein LysW [Bacillota bacterium]